ncbi:MAG: beta-propeller fold lactonase family protein [Candidatus Sulfotelmatobacter sp.]|jgi:6-phosphogluconolactonase (cycloisomerase 2 family)
MRTRFTWVLAVAVLVLAAVMLACSTNYSSSSNGLVVVSTQTDYVMDGFSLTLGNGHISQIYNAAGPPTNGIPTAVVLDPAGANAYVLIAQSTYVNNSSTGVESFPVNSDGKLASGKTTVLQPLKFTPSSTGVQESVSVRPTALAIDSGGKLLFIADVQTSDSSGNAVPGAVSVLSVGSNGALTEVSGSPFLLTGLPGSTTLTAIPSASALAVTPTVFPPSYAACSGNVAPTTENLYVTDSNNYVVLNYSVSSAGALTLVSENATGKVPSGVTVDPCNRFVFVSNSQPDNTISAFTICSSVNLPTCTLGDYSLIPVSGPAVPAGGNAPGPLMMDAYANFLYVLDTGQTSISVFRVGATTGALTVSTPATVATNSFPTSMAIRSDDTWMIVTNLSSSTLSEYSITPATGVLTPQTPIQTDPLPWGVAIK